MLTGPRWSRSTVESRVQRGNQQNITSTSQGAQYISLFCDHDSRRIETATRKPQQSFPCGCLKFQVSTLLWFPRVLFLIDDNTFHVRYETVSTLLQYYVLCPLVNKDATLVHLLNSTAQDSAIVFVGQVAKAKRWETIELHYSIHVWCPVFTQVSASCFVCLDLKQSLFTANCHKVKD